MAGEVKLRPLILRPEERKEIKRVMDFANAHRVDFGSLKAGAEGVIAPVGDNPNYCCVVPVGYRCVFSIEQQPPPMGWTRHISISVIGQGDAPSIPAVDMLLTEFGFTCDSRTADSMQLERIDPQDHNKVAVNLWQRIK